MPPNLLLKTERDKRGWSQAEVAKMIKAGEASYQRWESQGVVPTHYYRRALSRLFGKTIEELGLLPGRGSQSSAILAKDADLDVDEIHRVVNANLFLQLCTIMDESTHEDRCEKYAAIIEEFENMSTQNEVTPAITRRQAVLSLALLPFSPPLGLDEKSVHTLPVSKYDLFLQECEASIVACEDLAKSSDISLKSLLFQCVSRYLVELKEIIRSSSQYRQRAQELAARYAILRTNVGWTCRGDTATLLFAKEAVEMAKDSGRIELYLSAQSKLAWSYLYQGEAGLALRVAEDATAILKRYKGPLPVSIYGGTYSTLSVIQSHNFLDPDYAMKKAEERGSPENTSLYGMKFTEPDALLERGIALAGHGQTDKSMEAYSQIVDPKSLEVVPAFRGILTEGVRWETISYMAEASLTGDARNMGEAIRYWEYVCNFGIKSKHRASKISAIYRAMRLAFPGEEQISQLSELLREKSRENSTAF